MRAVIAGLAVCLSGCAAGWAKPGAGEQEFYQARFACQQRAAAMYPTAITAMPTYTTAQNMNCRVSPMVTPGAYPANVNCTKNPGVTYGGQQYDANANARDAAFASCMRAEGWTFKIQ